MKIIIRYILAGFICFIPTIAAADDWKELKGEHFIVYYAPQPRETSNSDVQATPESFANTVLFEAERYYQRIASNIGYARSSEFWTWEKRVKIYIYPDRDSYLKSGDHPSWSEGVADYQKKSILSFYGSHSFIDSILPHEIAHLIFRDFVGLSEHIPVWLDEGVAQWAEVKKQRQIMLMAKAMYMKDSLLTFSDMMKIDIRTVTDKTQVYIRPTITRQGDSGVLFLTGNELVNTYYLQAASLVYYMIDKFGAMEFSNFCRAIRDGKSVEDAIKSVYYTHIRDMNEFEQRWRQYIVDSS